MPDERIEKRKSTFRPRGSVENWKSWLGVLLVMVLVICGIGGWIQFKKGSIWDGKRRLTLAWVSLGEDGILKQVEDDETKVQDDETKVQDDETKVQDDETKVQDDESELLDGDVVVRVFSIEPAVGDQDKNSVTVIDLPGEVQMHVARGYGNYLVSGLYGLSKQENKMNLMTETLMYELGVPVEGYVISNFKVQSSNVKTKEDIISNLKSEILDWWRNNKVESNLSLGDRFLIWWKMRSVGLDEIVEVDFSEGNWASFEKELDGQPVIWFDKTTIDSRLPELLADSMVKKEGLEIRVVNTTSVDGLGGQIARMIAGLGMRVVEVVNEPGMVGQCVITRPSELAKSYAVERLRKVFDCQFREKKVDGERSDVEMRVGLEQERIWKGGT